MPNDIKNRRIHWIDACKGLLICMVVFSHLSSIGCTRGIDMPVLNRIGAITLLYKCFYMSLFFILNGYTTNYETDLKLFVVKRFKTLMIPAIVFSVITTVLNSVINGDEYYKEILSSVSFYVNFGVYWFLPALFGSNIIFILLYKFVFKKFCFSTLAEILVMSTISILGLLSSTIPNNEYSVCNPLYYRYMLFYSLFIYIGYKFKSVNISKYMYLISFVLYFGVLCSFIFLHISIPQFTGWINCTPSKIPFLYFLTLFGSLMFAYCSKLIKSSMLLEYIGKNSLVIYLIHTILLSSLFMLAESLNYQCLSIVVQIVCVIAVFVLTLMMSLGISYLVSMKYIRVIIGKF